LAPFLFGWLDWGASAPWRLAFADALVCCSNKKGFMSINVADIKVIGINEKGLTNCLESLCQSGSGYRWWCLSSLGGDLLKAHTPMHNGSQSGSIVAD